MDETFVSKTCHSKHWLESLPLWPCDKDIILSPTGSLNDSVINAAQQLLSRYYCQLLSVIFWQILKCLIA